VHLPTVEGIKVGEVAELDKERDAIVIGTGKGVLGVKRLQLEGKKEMTASDFIHGQRDFIETQLS
jgi:methionyl-tRNA formyltransferase